MRASKVAGFSICICLLYTPKLLGDTKDNTGPLEVENSSTKELFTPKTGPKKNRGDGWRPLLSFFLPGFDQHAAGQNAYGIGYSALAIGAIQWSSIAADNVEKFEKSERYLTATDDEKENYENLKPIYQERSIASQFYTVAGGFSAYHSFRTSVDTRRHLGEYEFLPDNSEADSIGDILLAPFDFTLLKEPTTSIPLLIIAGIAAGALQNTGDDFEKDPYTTTDAVNTAVISFNAGTNEEALFRGWLFPYFTEHTGSVFWGNVSQSVLFAAAHLGQTSVPIVQLTLGYYFGWLTERNNWSMREAVFIHAWWDVFALSIQYGIRKKTEPIWLPPLKIVF